MDSSFDRWIDRVGTGCLKYDFARERGRPPEALPLWVADMDFATAPAVTDALHKAVEHGIFGYSAPMQGYFDAVLGWFRARFGYEAKREWMVHTPGVVYALATAVRALTAPADSVLIFTPVYYPFYEVVRDNGRTLVESPLCEQDGQYTIDFDDMERKVVEHRVKLVLFCSPHNPVGRVWSKDELSRFAALCEKHDLLVVSDEIHCDFVWQGQHTMLPTISAAIAARTILCTAPSKTFNLAGLQISNCFIQNPQLRRQFRHEMNRTGYSQMGGLGLVACQAAYAEGGAWLDALKAYLWDNIVYCCDTLGNIPGIRVRAPQGTYLVWFDCAGLGLSDEALEQFILHKAGLWLDGGAMFGAQSAQYQRINIACPRKVLTQALHQLRDAVEGCRIE